MDRILYKTEVTVLRFRHRELARRLVYYDKATFSPKPFTMSMFISTDPVVKEISCFSKFFFFFSSHIQHFLRGTDAVLPPFEESLNLF